MNARVTQPAANGSMSTWPMPRASVTRLRRICRLKNSNSMMTRSGTLRISVV
jgi:hypothetical protein